MKRQQITVRVPATTSNLGPGFDCLGVALRIYNYITVARAREVEAGAMAKAAAWKFFRAARVRPIAFTCAITGEVPQSRGLGSSVTVRLGLCLALNALLDQPLTREKIYRLCVELEGHPDNAAPAAFGGFVVAGERRQQKFPIHPRLRFVLLIPPFEVKTEEARRVLPNEIDRRRAVASSAHACALTAAMASGRYRDLAGAFDDHLHQPYREKFVPFLRAVISAGEKAGALGGFLSGSGSTIACLTLGRPEKVAAAMRTAAGLPNECSRITTADNEGARLFHAPLA